MPLVLLFQRKEVANRLWSIEIEEERKSIVIIMWWLYLVLFLIPLVLMYMQHSNTITKAEFTEQLRKVAQEMKEQSEMLAKEREAARESKAQALQREHQLSSLRTQLKTITDELNHMKTERDEARNALQASEAKNTQLTSLLAKTEAKRSKLEEDMSAASIRHLEEVSKLHIDQTQRMKAIRTLRQPQQKLISPDDMKPIHMDKPVFLNNGSMHAALTKSPSEACLRDLKPDLEASEDEEEEDVREQKVTEMEFIQLPTTSQRRLDVEKEADDVRRNPTVQNESRQNDSRNRSMSIHRNPWMESLNLALDRSSTGGSIAQILEDEIELSSQGLISRNSRSPEKSCIRERIQAESN